ncbi:MAG: Cof-type HAD-IIB family hydrolase [Defluviitaleaceae bacterium]|nr:Cof-type HAD-IIB family hydrolase [Defluviitaleaceae bacterium]
MERAAFFFDFDGTLYSHAKKSVPASARAALFHLAEQGHFLAVATGRSFADIGFISKELAVPIDYMIVLNGQQIYHKGQLTNESFIQLASMEKIIQTACENNIAYGGYGAAGLMVNCLNPRVEAVWREFNSGLPVILDEFEKKHQLYHGHLYATEEEMPQFASFLGDYVTNRPHEYLINLIDSRAGKSRAIRILLEEQGIPKERAWAFGDGFNDIDMLQAVGHPVAMGDADENLRAVAELVTGRAEENGIAEALAEYGFFAAIDTDKR